MKEYREVALTVLQKLVGCCFRYGLKAYDMDLFDLGFGDDVSFVNCLGDKQLACRYALHFTCGIKLFWKDGCVDEYDALADSKQFSSAVKPLIGRKVNRIALSDKNDLWIDLSLCNIVIVTYEDDIESWRFFSPGTGNSHLIASEQRMYFE